MRRSLRTIIASRPRAVRRPCRAPSDLQAVDRLAVDDVAIDDLVDIVLVDVRVPNCFRVHDHARSLVTTIKTSRLVDPDLAWTGEAELFDTLLGVRLHLRGIVVCTTCRTVVAYVEAEEDMTFEITHAVILVVRIRSPLPARELCCHQPGKNCKGPCECDPFSDRVEMRETSCAPM